jgi:hypothetical protein
MIQGLKSAFTGEEIIRSLDARIEAKRAAIEFKRDEIRGTVQPVGDNVWQVSAEEVEDEIEDIEHSIRTLTLIRDRLLPRETYLLGRKGLRQAGLMPQRPEQMRELDPEKGIRWVTRAAR